MGRVRLVVLFLVCLELLSSAQATSPKKGKPQGSSAFSSPPEAALQPHHTSSHASPTAAATGGARTMAESRQRSFDHDASNSFTSSSSFDHDASNSLTPSSSFEHDASSNPEPPPPRNNNADLSSYCAAVQTAVGLSSKAPAPHGSHGRVVVAALHGKPHAIKHLFNARDYKEEVAILSKLPSPPAGINIVLNDRSDPDSHGFCPKPRLLIVLDKLLTGGQLTLNPRTLNPALTSLNAKLAAVLDVARAIQWLGTQGFVHGDVRGDNAMLDEQGHAYLIDMGNTGAIGQPYRTEGAPFNCFFCPLKLCGGDQSRGVTMQVSDDVFRLGVTLVHMLAGMTPCGNLEESLQCVFQRMRNRDWGQLESWRPEAAAKFQAQVPQEPVRALVLGMLRDDETKRLTIDQVVHAITALLLPSAKL